MRASAGKSLPDRPARRHRSTRRRQDAPDLPRRKVSPRTIGKTYTAPDGKTFRPSLFVTLTCPSYGRVDQDGAPVDPGCLRLRPGGPGRADLRRAVRPVHPEPAPLPRLRRAVLRRRRTPAAPRPARPHRHPRHHRPRRAAPGPGRHLPPGLVARHSPVKYRRRRAARVGRGRRAATSTRPPGKSCRPGTRRSTSIGPDDQPWHVARFGDRFDAQGVLAGSKDAARCIGYLTKYLTKQVGDCHQAAHRPAVRLMPPGWPRRCAGSRARRGARTGSATASSPRTPGPAWSPAACKGKAHDADHLGYAGRRVLVSRKWSGKTLADHRADRKEWLLRTLGVSATDPARYAWELVAPV